MLKKLLLLLALFSSVHANEWLHDYVEKIPNFPKQGIQFRWFAKLLKDPEAFDHAIQLFVERYAGSDVNVIAGIDSRGFIFGTALAREMGLPFVLVRKSGKLPKEVVSVSYALEYGENQLEMEKDSVSEGDKVLIIDDLLATGGTANAACELVRKLGGDVFEVACLIELVALDGKKNLKAPFFSLLQIDD